MTDTVRPAAIADFEHMGEDHVRLWLQETQNTQAINTKMRRSWAVEWLAAIDQQSRLRSEFSQAESLVIAISAKDAAWVAAEAAREAARTAKTANIIATLALAGAAIAIAVSIVSAFLR